LGEAGAPARRRPRFGVRVPCTNSARCVAQRSFWRFREPTLIETVSSAGAPHTSHTTTSCSAIAILSLVIGLH